MKLVTTIPRNQVVTVSDPESGAVLLVFETASRSTLRFEGVNVSYEPCATPSPCTPQSNTDGQCAPS